MSDAQKNCAFCPEEGAPKDPEIVLDSSISDICAGCSKKQENLKGAVGVPPAGPPQDEASKNLTNFSQKKPSLPIALTHRPSFLDFKNEEPGSSTKRNFLTRRSTDSHRRGLSANFTLRSRKNNFCTDIDLQNDSLIQDTFDLLKRTPKNEGQHSANEPTPTGPNPATIQFIAELEKPFTFDGLSIRRPSVRMSKNEISKQLCPTHSKPLEAVCENVTCQTQVCFECALFGHHAVRSLGSPNKKNRRIRAQFPGAFRQIENDRY